MVQIVLSMKHGGLQPKTPDVKWSLNDEEDECQKGKIRVLAKYRGQDSRPIYLSPDAEYSELREECVRAFPSLKPGSCGWGYKGEIAVYSNESLKRMLLNWEDDDCLIIQPALLGGAGDADQSGEHRMVASLFNTLVDAVEKEGKLSKAEATVDMS